MEYHSIRYGVRVPLSCEQVGIIGMHLSDDGFLLESSQQGREEGLYSSIGTQPLRPGTHCYG